MAFLKKISSKELESILQSFKISYAELKLLNEVNNEHLFVVDLNSRFVLYYALQQKYFDNTALLTSKFIINYLKLSFQTTQKIFSNLTRLGLLSKIRSTEDQRIFIYEITRLGEKSILLWESFKANDYDSVKKISTHNDGLLDMTEKRMAELSKEFLEN